MPLDPELRRKILASVAAGFDEQVDFTRKLFSVPSTRGGEHAIQDFIFQAYRSRGYTLDRFAMDKAAIAAHPGGAPWSSEHSDAPIVVGIHHPRVEAGRSLILQSHIDVVPPGPDAKHAGALLRPGLAQHSRLRQVRQSVVGEAHHRRDGAVHRRVVRDRSGVVRVASRGQDDASWLPLDALPDGNEKSVCWTGRLPQRHWARKPKRGSKR